MKFPVTRESLQAYDYAKEQKEEWIQTQLTLLLNAFCKDFERDMSSNLLEKNFVWRDLQHKLSMVQCQTIPDVLPRLIEKIKETFIGCDIVVDTLKTHIRVDWS